MLTMYPGMVNSPITELAAAIDETQTTIEVIDGTKLPDAPNLAIIGRGEDAETILYTEKTGNILSGVTRGFQGVAKAWGQGTRIARFFTEYDQRAMMQNIQENADNLASHLRDKLQDGVHGLATKSDMTLYVDVVNGDDSNDGLTPQTAFKTIQKAIDRVPLVLDDARITIQLATGTYQERVMIKNILGSGWLEIVGGSSITEAQNYIIDEQVQIQGCTCGVVIKGITVKGNSITNGAITVGRSLAVEIDTCIVDKSGREHQLNNYGVNVGRYSFVTIINCSINNIAGGSNVNAAIQCFETSRIYSVNNTGSGNDIGLRCTAGTIMKNGTQPSGTTAEVSINGGVIR